METFLIIVLSIQPIINLFSFILGARIGQKVVNNEKIEVNPIKAVREEIKEQKAEKIKEEEDNYYNTILHNIDVYDGTSNGQQPVPILRK